MRISEFYQCPSIVEVIGNGRIRKTISAIRNVLPEYIPTSVTSIHGRLPWFYKPVNPYYAAWVLYILCNARSHREHHVVTSIESALTLRHIGNNFIDDLAKEIGHGSATTTEVVIYRGNTGKAVITNRIAGTSILYTGPKQKDQKIAHTIILSSDFIEELSDMISKP